MNSKAERKEMALRCFTDHLHCSQSILAAFSEECGITEETAFRLGSCFGSGMRKGNVCGACTGALMVLGLIHGENNAGDQEGRLRTNRLNDLMMDSFSKANGSCICNELLGCLQETGQRSMAASIGRQNHVLNHFIATAVNSPGIVSSSHAGCSSKRFRVNPLLMMAFIISLIVYLLYRHLGNCSRVSLS